MQRSQIAQAVIVDEKNVDPAYDISTEINNLNTYYSNQKKQVSQIAERGSILSLLLSASVIGVLFWKFIQAGQLNQLAIAEQKLLPQSEEWFRSLVQNASDVLIVVNAEAEISYVTISAYRVLGYLPENLVGTNVSNLVDTDNTGQLQNFVSNCLKASGVTQLIQLPFKHQDGHLCYVELIGNLIP